MPPNSLAAIVALRRARKKKPGNQSRELATGVGKWNKYNWFETTV
jgi:hypothetical protein